jgi:hypothetical protein
MRSLEKTSRIADAAFVSRKRSERTNARLDILHALKDVESQALGD